VAARSVLRKRSQASDANDISDVGCRTKRASPLTCPAWENAFGINIHDLICLGSPEGATALLCSYAVGVIRYHAFINVTSYSFRISKGAVAVIVVEVCKATWKKLQEHMPW
jgi:hypothetical protein